MEQAAYHQTREAIGKIRSSLEALEKHLEHFHTSGQRTDLARAQVKLQDLFAEVSALQTCLNRCADNQGT